MNSISNIENLSKTIFQDLLLNHLGIEIVHTKNVLMDLIVKLHYT